MRKSANNRDKTSDARQGLGIWCAPLVWRDDGRSGRPCRPVLRLSSGEGVVFFFFLGPGLFHLSLPSDQTAKPAGAKETKQNNFNRSVAVATATTTAASTCSPINGLETSPIPKENAAQRQPVPSPCIHTITDLGFFFSFRAWAFFPFQVGASAHGGGARPGSATKLLPPVSTG